MNRGSEKVNRLEEWIHEKNLEGEEIWAYADSESDIPLLEFVDIPIVVQPTRSMEEVAKLRGWPIL